MKTIQLTKSEARKIMLHAAGLTKRGMFGKGIEAVYKVIDQLGYVQVDTNFTVERAHHHTFFSRIPGYQTEWLTELQADGRIYEFWTRDSGFMPMDEFRFSIPVHNARKQKYADITPQERSLMNKILDRIGRDGPLSAKDFDNDREVKSSGWWDWRPSKVALERLHMSGELLATRKPDFHKLYDLTNNIIPVDTDRTEPTSKEYYRHIITRSLRSLGVTYAKDIAWNARFVKHNIKAELQLMVEEGKVLQVQAEGLKAPLYMLPSYRNKKISLTNDVFILSPFDMINFYRHKLKDFFDFDYQVECFVPEPNRKYGYFSLPILAGETFIARMDSKADRKTRNLIIHNLHFEKIKLTEAVADALIEAIRAFAEFNSCYSVTI
ncbi:MAG: crosslink repair DNA glycosylase YcaQ family protein, partial [Flavitalea sp.]